MLGPLFRFVHQGLHTRRIMSRAQPTYWACIALNVMLGN